MWEIIRIKKKKSSSCLKKNLSILNRKLAVAVNYNNHTWPPATLCSCTPLPPLLSPRRNEAMSAFLWLSYLIRSQTGFPALVQRKSWLIATACPCQAKQRDP